MPKVDRLLLLSLVWAATSCNLAYLAPWSGLWPTALAFVYNSLPLAITGVLIVLNLMMSLRLVGRSGHVLAALPLTLVQLVLFTLLFFQIACHRGAEHYSWDGTPFWWHWLAFSGDHVLRGVDLLDAIEAYDWKLQPIEHHGHLP